jgi:hypothetical protein
MTCRIAVACALFLGTFLCTAFRASPLAPSQDAVPGTVKGRIEAVTGNETKLIPDSATVTLIYWGRSHDLERSTAGEAYIAEATKVATSIAKQTSRDKEKIAEEPKEQRVDEFEKYKLQTVDAGLKAAAAWSVQHKNTWQLITVSVSPSGLWSQENVTPGHYRIIARGKVGTLDAEWETEVDVEPGETISVPLTRVKMGRAPTP